MKTFTKTLAALLAVSLAALAFSSCKKVQPTELTADSNKATVIKGSVVYNEYDDAIDGKSSTTFKILTEGNVTITTKIKTGEFTENEKGEKIEETIASVQTVPIVEQKFQATLPVAPGETYTVLVRCEFEKLGYMKIGGKNVPTKKALIKYKGEAEVKVAYGQIFVENLTAAADGYEATSEDGAGQSSGYEEPKPEPEPENP